MCDIDFEKTKGRGGTVNQKQKAQENICAEISFLINLNSVDLQLH